ncbi:MAG: UbiA prenyltransferase family protein [Myxococcales bacterium]|nr:UbiA prenyltransferase family protein [Myxococcales bacterium]MCB9581248.1 UbiA prenyltransferase family protein [Polyangiaceae bacterium]
MSSVTRLAREGTRYLGALVRGRAPQLGLSSREFAWAVLSALRPHFFVFPAGAVLAGAASAEQLEAPTHVALASLAAGLGWGVGQLINDLLDVEADRVDAPHRPAPRGLLPEGPTTAIAMLLGVFVAIVTLGAHAAALWLVIAATLLLLAYQPAKAHPGLGNLAHGALIGTAAVIGRAAALPSVPLGSSLSAVLPTALACAAVAALYLQANYEKDRVGDAKAGYHTLAHVLGVRGSAIARGLGALSFTAITVHLGIVRGPTALVLLALALAASLGSSVFSAIRGTESASLASYRWACHGTAAAMLALAAPLLGAFGSFGALIVAVTLTERAFARVENP